ncbi:MAG: DNA ligase [Deltaproteobacteria bacterium]|jgi:DNA ligase 1|nr:DNA ligase [Deltaproteobacteria bacterium]MBT4525049.1 DNA ligase [Deltaproteobacteria bacterium]
MEFIAKKLNFFIVIITVFLVNIDINAQDFKLQKPMVYKGSTEVVNWFMSEKLDGIRGYWDGKQLMTRKGKLINAPKWFLKNFPSFELDGELWSTRNDFEFIQSTVLTKKPSIAWKKITYNIFEVPNATGNFKLRLHKVKKWFSEHQNDYVRIIPQTTCLNNEHLQSFIREVAVKGGEGVIIKDPKLGYHTGRSPHILKIKKSDDMEGEVIAINPGKGRLKGKMGSLTLKLQNGILFKLGTGFCDQERTNPPAIGAMVTFKYFNFTKNGIPRFASFLRIRKD